MSPLRSRPSVRSAAPAPRAIEATADIGMTLVVMVGAVAAAAGGGFLIYGALGVKEDSERAAEAASEVGTTSLKVVEIRIERTAEGVDEVRELVTPLTSAGAVDLRTLSLTLRLGEDHVAFSYAATPSTPGYRATAIRDADGSFTEAAPLVNQGDLIELALPLGGDHEVRPGDGIEQIQAASGRQVRQDAFEVPADVQPDHRIVRLEILGTLWRS